MSEKKIENKMKPWTIRKNGWYCKLQIWTFGTDHNPLSFKSVCPFFWLTIFCVLVSPFMAIAKGCRNLFLFIGHGCVKMWQEFDEHICMPLYEWNVTNMSDRQIFNLDQFQVGSYDSDMAYKVKQQFRERISTFKRIYGDKWETKWGEAVESERKKQDERNEEARKRKAIQKKKDADYKRIKLKEKALREEHEAILRERGRARAIRQQKIIDAAIKWTQRITPYCVGLLVTAIALLVGWGVYEGVTALMVWWSPEYTVDIMYGGQWLVLGSLGLGALVFTVMTLGRLLKKCDLKFTCPIWVTSVGDGIGTFIKTTFKYTCRICVSIGAVVAYPFRKMFTGLFIGISEMGSFVCEYVKATKEGYCPMIKWDDENKN